MTPNSSSAIKLTLYDPDTSEIVKEFSRAFIPTGIFTEIARLMQVIDLEHPERIEPETVDALYALVAELFGNQITIEEIKTGTDLREFAVLLNTLMARVGNVIPAAAGQNPTRPVQANKRHR